MLDGNDPCMPSLQPICFPGLPAIDGLRGGWCENKRRLAEINAVDGMQILRNRNKREMQ